MAQKTELEKKQEQEILDLKTALEAKSTALTQAHLDLKAVNENNESLTSQNETLLQRQDELLKEGAALSESLKNLQTSFTSLQELNAKATARNEELDKQNAELLNKTQGDGVFTPPLQGEPHALGVKLYEFFEQNHGISNQERADGVLKILFPAPPSESAEEGHQTLPQS